MSPRGQVFCAFPRASRAARCSRFPMLALEHVGELPHRRTGDQLDRHAVFAQRERQLLSVGSAPGKEGEVAVPAERDVELRRVGASGAPAMLTLDDPPPQEDPADDGADRLTRRVAAPDEARRRLDRARGVKSALTVGLRRSVQGWRGRPPPIARPFAAGDYLPPRRPDGAVHGRAEAEVLPARHDEPTPPANHRRRVVRRARRAGPYAGTFSGSRGSSTGSSSGGSSGSSRGTGSSSGSTVTVRSGSPISIASLVLSLPQCRDQRRRLGDLRRYSRSVETE
jgi:uncharacterized membrane protein YgcG